MTELTPPQLQRFAPLGLLAMDPKAFGLEFLVGRAPSVCMVAGGQAAVVEIDGPITYASWLFDSYGAIKARAAEAFKSDAPCVILKIGSPGGDVFGAFDTARELRVMAKAAGKRLLAFTDSQACSSAYALASAAESISASDSAVVGSIGVISSAVEMSRADKAMGLNFTIVASGSRKTDGNPHVPASDDMREATQRQVDALASVFFKLVADHRGDSIERLAALQAGTFIGSAALEANLIDRVESWDALLSRVEAGLTVSKNSAATSAANSQSNTMPADNDNKDDARKALAAAAADEDPKKAARAKRALAAYDDDSDKSAVDDKDPPKDEDKKDAKAVAPSAAAAAVAPSSLGATSDLAAALSAAQRQIQALTARNDANDRAALFAARPDIPAGTQTALAKVSTADLPIVLAGIPKAAALPTNVDTQAAAAATQGSTAASSVVDPKNPPQNSLSAAMGLVPMAAAVVYDPRTGVQEFGVSIPVVK